MSINKILYGNEVLIDLTSDTVQADKLLQGYTAHDNSGTVIFGSVQNGDNLGYGSSTYPFMVLGTGLIGTGRVI